MNHNRDSKYNLERTQFDHARFYQPIHICFFRNEGLWKWNRRVSLAKVFSGSSAAVDLLLLNFNKDSEVDEEDLELFEKYQLSLGAIYADYSLTNIIFSTSPLYSTRETIYTVGNVPALKNYLASGSLYPNGILKAPEHEEDGFHDSTPSFFMRSYRLKRSRWVRTCVILSSFARGP
jgi:hypothetical protein